jgi:hypothetical protein
MNVPQPDFRAMTSSSMGKSILRALVAEIRLPPGSMNLTT